MADIYTFKYKHSKFDPLPIKGLTFIINHQTIRWVVHICTAILHLAIFIYGLFEKALTVYPQWHITETSLKIVDLLAFFILVLANLMSFAWIHKNVELFNLMFYLQENSRSSEPLSSSTSETFLRRFVVLLGITDVTFSFLQYEFTVIRYTVAHNVEFWCFAMNICTIMYCFHRIKQILENLNNYLLKQEFRNITGKAKNGILLPTTHFNYEHSTMENLKFILQYHNHICNMVIKFNMKFKALLTILFMCINLTILWNMAIIIKFSMMLVSTETIEPCIAALFRLSLRAVISLVSYCSNET